MSRRWAALLLAATLWLMTAAAAALEPPPPPPIAPPPMLAGRTVCPADPEWNTPAYPMRVHGETWFVGTCGISALLLTSAEGHILIDGGTEAAAAQVLANIRMLGYDPQDVRYILTSHEHHDHAGALDALQRATGAPVLASSNGAFALRRGGALDFDPQSRELKPFPPVAAVRVVEDGEIIRLGPHTVTAVNSRGHAPGGLSWRWRSCDARTTPADCREVVYADSLTAAADAQFRFTDETANFGALTAFRATLTRIAELPCEILLTPHPSASRLWQRIGADAREPLVDAGACRAYADAARARLDARVAEEQRAAPPTR